MRLNLTWIEKQRFLVGRAPTNYDEIYSLYKMGIRAIVTLTEDPLNVLTEANEAQLKTLVELHHAPIDDFQAPPSHDFVKNTVATLQRLLTEDKPVYMHCLAGQGRTGTLIHAYYLLQGLNLENTIAKVREIRPYSGYGNLSKEQQHFLKDFAKSL